MSDTRLRLRAIGDERFAVLLALCVVLAAVGGWAAFSTHVAPETTQEERVVAAWESSGAYDHGATVTEANSVFSVGTDLTDRQAYFTRIVPEFDATFEHVHSAPDALDVELDAELVMRSADEDTVYWSETEDLGTERREAVPADEPVTIAISLNASQLDDRLSEIRDELGTTPGDAEVFVRTDVIVSGTVDGEMVELQRSEDLLVDLQGDTYVLTEREASTQRIEQTESVTIAREYGPLRAVGGPVLLLLGLAGTVGLVVARRRNELRLSEGERTYLDYRDDREEFGEWITRIRLPDSVRSLPEAEAASLADLVDFAIDVDAGVVEDPITGDYHVAHDGTLYSYDPPTNPNGGTVDASEPDDSAADSTDSSPELDVTPAPSPGESADGLSDPTLDGNRREIDR